MYEILILRLVLIPQNTFLNNKNLKMKKFFILCFALAICAVSNAQDKPAPSPSGTIMQKVGLTDVTVEYSRPGVKGRTIFAADGLVPFGKLWRTGANSITKITFSDDVTIEGQALAAGSYGLLTEPSAGSWKVNLYKHDGTRWSGYTGKTPDVSVTVTPAMMGDSVESFTIDVGNLTDNSAVISLLWEKTWVPIKLGVK